jgi:hypothetical protein
MRSFAWILVGCTMLAASASSAADKPNIVVIWGD